MDPKLPLVDDLATALNSLLAGTITPDDARAVIARYDLERDRTDLDCATLPVRTVIVIQEGIVTDTLTSHAHGHEVLVVNYDVDQDHDGDTDGLAQIPQEGSGGTALAEAFIIIPAMKPARLAQLFRAAELADSPSNHVH